VTLIRTATDSDAVSHEPADSVRPRCRARRTVHREQNVPFWIKPAVVTYLIAAIEDVRLKALKFRTFEGRRDPRVV